MNITTLIVSVEIPIEKKEKIPNLFELIKNEEAIKIFKPNSFQNQIFFTSEDGNRLITLEPENTISITFNPKNLTNQVILKVEEEINEILNLISKKYSYNHLHQNMHIHLDKIKLKFNPVNLVEVKDMRDTFGDKLIEVGMVGFEISIGKDKNAKITFFKDGTLGIAFKDFNSNKVNIINNRNAIFESLESILEK